MIIYVLTAGDYSDYHIVAVAETKERAEKLKEKLQPFNRYCDIEIEEYDTEQYSDGLNDRPAWAVFFNVNGAAVGMNRMDIWAYMDMCDDHCRVKVNYCTKDLRVLVCAEDERHALKAASEIRAQYLMDNQEFLEMRGYYDSMEVPRKFCDFRGYRAPDYCKGCTNWSWSRNDVTEVADENRDSED